MSIANDFRREGREQGMHEGLELGLQRGRQEGRLEEREMVARNMLKNNISIDVISKFTKLSLEEIKTIQKKDSSFVN